MTRFIGATPDRFQEPLHACDRPAVLHVGHSWGGGIDRWIQDYAAADRDNWNLLLRSRTWRNEAGVELELVDLTGEDEVLLAWKMVDPIPCTAVHHAQYRRILQEVVPAFGVEAVLVSSLIGHALDVLETGLPTVVVLHDFVPFCPALFAWFGAPCVNCDRDALERCLATNPQNVFWHHDDVGQWLALREAYAQRLATPQVRVAAPGRRIHDRYARLFPVLRDKPWQEIPHGLGNLPKRLRPGARSAGPGGPERARLRVLLPGRLLPHKGLHLFAEMVGELTRFAEILLLGCGDFGQPFQGMDHVEVVSDYANETLGERVDAFAPDCALLLSILPESFSYTLSEMTALAVPVVATRLGAFADRIEDGRTGFLVEPRAEAILARLRELVHDRALLRRVADNLQHQTAHTAAAMVQKYRALLGLDAPDRAIRRPRPGPIAAAAVREAAVRRFLRQEGARQRMRADAQEQRANAQEKRADAQEARANAQEQRADAQEARADAQEKRADAQEARANAQEKRADAQEARANAQEQRADAQEARANAQEKRADAQEARANALQARTDAQAERLATLEKLLTSQQAHLSGLAARLAATEAERAAILMSKSWRMTAPMRRITHLLRREPSAAGPGTEARTVPDGALPAGALPKRKSGPIPGPITRPHSEPVPTTPSDKMPDPPGDTNLNPPGLIQGPIGSGSEGAVRAETANGAAEPADATDPARPALPGEAAQSPRIEVDDRDPLALARAWQLARTLAMPVEPASSATGHGLTEGFAARVHCTGPGGDHRAIACFEGLEDAAEAPVSVLNVKLDRVLVPSRSVARCFEALWPESRATVAVIGYPVLVGRPTVADRVAARMRQRETLGLPDSTRLVLGIGRGGSRAGLDHFGALATRTCERRNDVRFVWLGTRDPSWESEHWLDVGLPVALRRLFFIEEADPADWLLAADAYVGCRSPQVHDPGAIQALAAGLPVCVASRASLPDVLCDPRYADLVDEVHGEAVADWLGSRLGRHQRRERAGDEDLVARAIPNLGVPDLVSAIRSACKTAK